MASSLVSRYAFQGWTLSLPDIPFVLLNFSIPVLTNFFCRNCELLAKLRIGSSERMIEKNNNRRDCKLRRRMVIRSFELNCSCYALTCPATAMRTIGMCKVKNKLLSSYFQFESNQILGGAFWHRFAFFLLLLLSDFQFESVMYVRYVHRTHTILKSKICKFSLIRPILQLWNSHRSLAHSVVKGSTRDTTTSSKRLTLFLHSVGLFWRLHALCHVLHWPLSVGWITDQDIRLMYRRKRNLPEKNGN